MKQGGLSNRHHLAPDELWQLLAEVGDVSGRGRATGHRMLRAQLASELSIRPPLSDVMDVLRENDPAASAARLERLLRRTVYNVDTAMDLWHMDSA